MLKYILNCFCVPYGQGKNSIFTRQSMQIRRLTLGVLLGCLFPVLGLGQFTDNFSDGDYTANPLWDGDTARFDVNGSNELWLNAPAVADTAVLYTSSASISNATWEFLVKLSFNPSSSNYTNVYLVADNPNLKGPVNGYFVKVGNTADEVSLYRQDGNAQTMIINGRDKSVNTTSVNVRVKVTRDSVGNWNLMNDTTGGTTYISEGTIQDQTYLQSAFFGVYCMYTSTRSNKMFFDDFNVTGQAFVDTIKPVVDSVKVISTNQLDVYFSEFVDMTTSQGAGNYVANNGLGSSSGAVRDGADSSLVHLTFGSPFVNGQPYMLTVSNVKDLPGNVMVTQNIPFLYFIPDTAQFGDVVINEIMADPSPVVGLPDAEYVEFFNASKKIFDLAGWQFSDGGTPVTLPSYVLLPDSHVFIIDDADTALFKGFNNVLVMTSVPSLNNGGDPLDLKNDQSTLIDAVTYTDAWYRDPNKDGGGYSLERINPYILCSGVNNWKASNDPKGGTPGARNSVFDNTPDTQGPSIVNIEVHNPLQITVTFDEKLDSASIFSAVWQIDNGVTIALINAVMPDYLAVTLTFGANIQTGVVYELQVSGITDCSGNAVVGNKGTFVLPVAGAPGDLIVNEVLFDPRTGGSDFVEIYNNSDKYIDMRRWKMASYDYKGDSIGNFEEIPVQVIIAPHDFLVLTEDTANIRKEYPQAIPGKFYQIANLPTYNNDSGQVIVINRGDTVSDRLKYDADMQYPLLVSTDGVSLERINYDRPTDDRTNWHSASEMADWATPGFKNSQYQDETGDGSHISVSPEVFSPDNDGFEDVLTINYTLDEAGYTGSFTIYDPKGRIIRKLVNNDLLGSAGSVSWDGIRDDRQKALVGIYVIYFEAFSPSGKTIREKASCVLASKLH